MSAIKTPLGVYRFDHNLSGIIHVKDYLSDRGLRFRISRSPDGDKALVWYKLLTCEPSKIISVGLLLALAVMLFWVGIGLVVQMFSVEQVVEVVEVVENLPSEVVFLKTLIQSPLIKIIGLSCLLIGFFYLFCCERIDLAVTQIIGGGAILAGSNFWLDIFGIEQPTEKETREVVKEKLVFRGNLIDGFLAIAILLASFALFFAAARSIYTFVSQTWKVLKARSTESWTVYSLVPILVSLEEEP